MSLLSGRDMQDDQFFPRISTVFDSVEVNGLPSQSFYPLIVQNLVKKIFPSSFFSSSQKKEDMIEKLHAILPIVSSTPCVQAPANISFFVVSEFRLNSFKFFFEMISHWLIPGKRLNVVMIYAADFRLTELNSTVYTVCEVAIHVDHDNDIEQIRRNWPIIEAEVRLGMSSAYYARRILEIKGLSADAKTAMIQEYIAYLMSRKPKEFDYDVLTEMQHVLVMCRDDFKAARSCQHLSRIISIHYLFRKSLQEAIKKAPEKRHLSLKLFKARISNGEKTVLGILVGVNFLKDKEIFEKRHLLAAIQNYIPEAQAVENSFFANRRGSEHICTLYLELEKGGEGEFTTDEINILRRELPHELKDRIEYLMHPVFMPRNEEEIMRSILSLSSQIKYARDIPQVVINFDEQSHASLFFTIVLIRVVTPGSPSIQDLFRQTDTFMEYLHDRCKTVGFLRKKYTKEATVFRLKIPKQKQFIRRDHSIDLYKARQAVVLELLRIVGEFRDFNGGMISKQNELLNEVRQLLSEEVKYNDLLLENFFYALSPVIMRTVLEPEILKKVFIVLLEVMEANSESGDRCFIKIDPNPSFILAVIKSEQRSVKDDMNRALNKFHLQSSELAHSYLQIHDDHYMCYIYRCDDSNKQQQFCQALQNVSLFKKVPEKIEV